MKPETLTRWTHEQSAELYGIKNWGLGFYDIAPNGELVVRPHGQESDVSVSLLALVKDLEKRNMSVPVLLRFSDILCTRVAKIHGSFAAAIRDAGYRGEYRAVYPAKVNQQREVIEDIMAFGRTFHQGLEAGSKAELMAAMAYMSDPDAFLICNGYKDAEFIDLALNSAKMGTQTILVMEMSSELEVILECAARLKVRPMLGVRAKLSSRAGGHWDGSGGDRSKFGLDSSQIMDIVEKLRQHNMLDCLRLLHYHLGSQISDIRKVRTALGEACSFYVGLVKEGAAMGIINVGGGLAVDYDGSHTNYPSSTNYTMHEYANDVVEVIMDAMDKNGTPHPTIVSESGRATVAHHAVLVFNVLHVRRFEPMNVPEKLPKGLPEMLQNLAYVRETLVPRNVQEAYNDAVYYRDEVRDLFLHGHVSLRERALAESMFWQIVCRIADMVRDKKYIPEELAGLDAAIADVYYGNFSVFQSLPDSWAIDQMFPVMPIHRLNEYPSRRAVLADITCDSDGKIDRFIDLHDVKNVLPLHDVSGGGEYYLGAFLVGAYQETIGSMHNLLGDIDALHVRIGTDGQVEYVNEIAGDSVNDVLSYVEYNTGTLGQRIRDTAQKAVESGRITAEEKEKITAAYENSLKGYTYFER